MVSIINHAQAISHIRNEYILITNSIIIIIIIMEMFYNLRHFSKKKKRILCPTEER